MIPLSRGWGRLLINFFVFQTSESCMCVLILYKIDTLSVLIYLHYMRESVSGRHVCICSIQLNATQSERRLYTLRDQLKIQYKVRYSVSFLGHILIACVILQATQKAQINERKAAESKRRLTSYVISELCVSKSLIIHSPSGMSSMISRFLVASRTIALPCFLICTGSRSFKHSL